MSHLQEVCLIDDLVLDKENISGIPFLSRKVSPVSIPFPSIPSSSTPVLHIGINDGAENRQPGPFVDYIGNLSRGMAGAYCIRYEIMVYRGVFSL